MVEPSRRLKDRSSITTLAPSLSNTLKDEGGRERGERRENESVNVFCYVQMHVCVRMHKLTIIASSLTCRPC